jgi:hypothetical protein
MFSPSDNSSLAALQGAASAQIQRLLADFAEKLARRGFRVGGVVEIGDSAPGGACGQLQLRELSTAKCSRSLKIWDLDRKPAISMDGG